MDWIIPYLTNVHRVPCQVLGSEVRWTKPLPVLVDESDTEETGKAAKRPLQ